MSIRLGLFGMVCNFIGASAWDLYAYRGCKCAGLLDGLIIGLLVLVLQRWLQEKGA